MRLVWSVGAASSLRSKLPPPYRIGATEAYPDVDPFTLARLPLSQLAVPHGPVAEQEVEPVQKKKKKKRCRAGGKSTSTATLT